MPRGDHMEDTERNEGLLLFNLFALQSIIEAPGADKDEAEREKDAADVFANISSLGVSLYGKPIPAVVI